MNKFRLAGKGKNLNKPANKYPTSGDERVGGGDAEEEGEEEAGELVEEGEGWR